MLRRTVPLIVLILAAVVPGLGQEAKTPVFRVALKISGDAAAASRVEAYVTEELKILPDVVVAQSTPDYTIYVIAMQLESKEKVSMGMALSWLSLYHPKGFFQDCSLMEDYRLLTTGQDDLREDCRKLVARFDTQSLAPHRQVFRK